MGGCTCGCTHRHCGIFVCVCVLACVDLVMNCRTEAIQHWSAILSSSVI